MKTIEIIGNNELTGTIKIDGDKNSAVALIPAAILSDEEVTLSNVPDISDISALEEILLYLNATVTKEDNNIKINSSKVINKSIPEGIAKKLRASYYFMGALLGKYKKVEMYFPGGCNIGSRPIDQHFKGFESLGATIIEDKNKYTIQAEELIGTTIRIDMPGKGATTSVGATINIMLAAVKAKGVTIIENAAKEPQIVNVAIFLNNMGAKISGAGTDEIRIEGVNKLGKAFNEVIPDRIEAGTYIIAGAIAGNNIKVTNMIPEHCEALLNKLKEMGVPLTIGRDYVIVSKPKKYKSVDIKTVVYPGFVTDLQQPMTALLTKCEKTSTIIETIYENRFQNIEYLNKMGANIKITDNTPYKSVAEITGPSTLIGTDVTATDLRAGACLIVAALSAEGKTTIHEVEHILRGYADIVSKLKSVGANIELKDI